MAERGWNVPITEGPRAYGDYSSDAWPAVYRRWAWSARLSADDPVGPHLLASTSTGILIAVVVNSDGWGGHPQHLLQQQVFRSRLSRRSCPACGSTFSSAGRGPRRRRVCDAAGGRAYAGRARVLPDPVSWRRRTDIFQASLWWSLTPDRLHPHSQSDDAYPDRCFGHCCWC